jgi:hypothetical protein
VSGICVAKVSKPNNSGKSPGGAPPVTDLKFSQSWSRKEGKLQTRLDFWTVIVRFSVIVTNTWKKQFKGGKIYFAQCFKGLFW